MYRGSRADNLRVNPAQDPRQKGRYNSPDILAILLVDVRQSVGIGAPEVERGEAAGWLRKTCFGIHQKWSNWKYSLLDNCRWRTSLLAWMSKRQKSVYASVGRHDLLRLVEKG